MKFNFCVKCGSPAKQITKEKFQCMKCGYFMYANPRPSTAAVIMRGSRIMFVKRKKKPFKNWWDLPGGFLQERETPEQCVVREVKEETGLQVKPVRILGFSNDTYNDLRAMGVFFLCRIIGGKARAGDDAAELRWFDKNALPRNIAFRGIREGLKKYIGARFTKKAVK